MGAVFFLSRVLKLENRLDPRCPKDHMVTVETLMSERTSVTNRGYVHVDALTCFNSIHFRVKQLQEPIEVKSKIVCKDYARS